MFFLNLSILDECIQMPWELVFVPSVNTEHTHTHTHAYAHFTNNTKISQFFIRSIALISIVMHIWIDED